MKLTVLGCGRWGSFIAWYLEKKGHSVCLWGRPGSPRLAQLRLAGGNDVVTLGGGVTLADDLAAAVSFGEIVFVSISAQQLASLCEKIAPLIGARPLVLCMKGLEETTGRRLSEIAGDTVPLRQVAVWVGPGHVQDFAAGIPNCMVIDAASDALKHELVPILSSDLIRFYYGTDLIGNEIGAAAKNVIGIGAGILDGLGYASLKGALMARGAREISALIAALGGQAITAYGLSHLGDYEATVFSRHSRNRRYGEMLVRGQQMCELAEGVSTARALMVLSRKTGTELPISSAVHDVIHAGQDPHSAIEALYMRDLKREF